MNLHDVIMLQFCRLFNLGKSQITTGCFCVSKEALKRKYHQEHTVAPQFVYCKVDQHTVPSRYHVCVNRA